MAKRYSKVKRTLQVLGISAAIFASALSLTGCSDKELIFAQENIDSSVTTVLNSEDIQNNFDITFSDFTFLCADVEKNNNKYGVDINGIANYNNLDKKAYTTLSYEVGDSYFNSETTKNSATIINTLSTIVQNEPLQSYSVVNVNNPQELSTAVGHSIDVPLDDFKHYSNFLYGVDNLQFSNNDNVVSFSAKDISKFSRTRTEVTIGIVTYINGKPQYGPVTRVHTDYESFFFDHNIYVQLSPEEFEQAKTDESIVFDKFIEYVNSEQKDKYVIQETNVAKDKEFNANMKGEVCLENI